MNPLIDLTTLAWRLSGWRPFAWKLGKSSETGGFLLPEVGPFPARLPGSVQQNLLEAGAIPDWNIGRNSLAIEWIEHRHWVFSAVLPPASFPPGGAIWLRAEVLDHRGWIRLNGEIVGEFRGTHKPVAVDLTAVWPRSGAVELSLIFDLPPEGQGQLGLTSLARDSKPRYSFGWDWCVRVVPIGAAGSLGIHWQETSAPTLIGAYTDLSPDLATGSVTVRLASCAVKARARISVGRQGRECAAIEESVSSMDWSGQIFLEQPELWWPSGEGPPVLYDLDITLTAEGGRELGRWRREVGFRRIEWLPCADAPPGALPWLCSVNGRTLFLQGVNWTPVRMCYLDTKREEILGLVKIYHEMGCNLLRVWGGGYLESADFYSACDRSGLLVWQEFPLSSSGVDSTPPEDDVFLGQIGDIARHFIRSRQHHVSLLQWCGGNELHVETIDGPRKRRLPLTTTNRTLAHLADLVRAEDPTRRFLPTSPYGPRFHSEREEFGQGVHHEVHGPWGLDGFPSPNGWEDYWLRDDALFRGEIGVASASRVELIERQAGGESAWPPTSLWWHHSSGWWTQWDRLSARFGELEPAAALAAYVDHTRSEQAAKLAFAAWAKKVQFPRCGGFLVWMGHDAFPCLANTSIIEFDHVLKPAAKALAAVFQARPEDLRGSPAAFLPPGGG